ncbi:hypothetical protein [Marilutibacter chinensis]|uniref:Uncharacterized protein n=1 Tax=Marilutibacter chinensis TaxID=2912247 RepID=A0ABS9HZ21_9GAMM|nr:hypothetical protein [Lysobacter chinensis]MCF7223632.1 hypothetical protein [Lysobacter chinensis]
MPRFYSHDFPRPPHDLTTPEPAEPGGLEIPAATLGELLAHLEDAHGIRVVPHDPPKYFRYYPRDSDSAVEFHMVDIHIYRDGMEICPKQDLAFPLEDEDAIEAGPLMC